MVVVFIRSATLVADQVKYQRKNSRRNWATSTRSKQVEYLPRVGELDEGIKAGLEDGRDVILRTYGFDRGSDEHVPSRNASIPLNRSIESLSQTIVTASSLGVESTDLTEGREERKNETQTTLVVLGSWHHNDPRGNSNIQSPGWSSRWRIDWSFRSFNPRGNSIDVVNLQVR